MSYFYRTIPDGAFSYMGLEHIIFSLCIIFILFLDKKYLVKNSRILEKVILFVLIFDVLNRYLFYVITGYNLVIEGLPIYHCRIVVLLIIYSILSKSQFFYSLIYYWSVLGALSCVIYPVPDNFQFPHILTLLFFTSHISIFLYAKLKMDFVKRDDYKKVMVYTFLYNLFLYIVNQFLNSNYGTLSEPPFLGELFSYIGNFGYFLFANIVYLLAIYIIYFFTFNFKKMIKGIICSF